MAHVTLESVTSIQSTDDWSVEIIYYRQVFKVHKKIQIKSQNSALVWFVYYWVHDNSSKLMTFI